jgi:hypothetical protein
VLVDVAGVGVHRALERVRVPLQSPSTVRSSWVRRSSRNRIYPTGDSARAFLTSSPRFTGCRIVAYERATDGGQIGMPDETDRRVTISSPFGKRSSA